MLGRAYVNMPSGLILPERHAEEAARRVQPMTAMDFFAGAGGFSLGAKQAGMNVVAAVDNWFEAAVTYMTNLCRWGDLTIHFVTPDDEARFTDGLARMYRKQGFTIRDGRIVEDGKLLKGGLPLAGKGWIAHQPPTTPGTRHFFFGDIRALTGERVLAAIGMKVGELGCVFGGPPCQGFSISGKRSEADPRNDLIFEFARMIVELRPTTMAMENVPGITTMLSADGVPVVDKFCRILEDGGFGGYDAFRRTVASQAGAIGLLRGKPKPQREKSKPTRAELDSIDGQLDLLDEVA